MNSPAPQVPLTPSSPSLSSLVDFLSTHSGLVNLIRVDGTSLRGTIVAHGWGNGYYVVLHPEGEKGTVRVGASEILRFYGGPVGPLPA